MALGEAGGRHQGEEEQLAYRPEQVHEHAEDFAIQHSGHQVFLAIASRLLPGAPCEDQVLAVFTIVFFINFILIT